MRDPGITRTRAAYAHHHETDLHPSLTGFVQRADDLRVQSAIEFSHDMRRLAIRGQRRLANNHMKQGFQGKRCMQLISCAGFTIPIN
jgi:hypothetical protein